MPYEDEPQKQDHLMRRYAPLQEAVGREEMNAYLWKHEDGDIRNYKHKETGQWLHVDSQQNFYDRYANPIAKEEALARVHGQQREVEPERREEKERAAVGLGM